MEDATLEYRVAAGIVSDTESLIAIGASARKLVLNLRTGARSILAGAHLSRFRGRGMDYAESRDYAPGDDARHIDWRVTARTGRTHTKLYVEERERPVFILVDLSPGMFFGTRGSFKSVTAARAAAYTAWSVIAAGDRIGGVVASPVGIRDLRPAAGRRGVLRFLSVVAESTQATETAAATDAPLLDPALAHLCGVAHPGSLVVLFSDFHHCGEETRASLARLRKHCDMVACQVLDPLERELPAAASYRISDGNRKARLDLTMRSGQGRYRRYLAARQDRVQEMLREQRIPLVELVNGGDIEETLIGAFGGAHASETQ